MKRWAIFKKKSVKIVLANKNPVKQMETNIKPIVLGSFKNLAFTYPNKADRTIISAIVPTAIPVTEIQEIILITLCDFFEIK